MNRFRCLLTTTLLAVGLMLIPTTAFAQAMGADGFDEPTEDAPGEADTAPPTDDAGVHPGDEQPPPPAAAGSELGEGDFALTVQLHHHNDDDVELSGKPVLLEAVAPAGPLQPDGHERVISSWEATADADGIARFGGLPDELGGGQLMVRASAPFGGLSFDSQLTQPTPNSTVEVPLFDQTHSFPGIRVTQKQVVVSPWEEYLVFDQFWTIELEGDHAFDTTASGDFERGLPLRLPYRAEGTSVAGPGSNEIVDNIVYWHGVLQPDRPITLQIRFSKEARHPSFTFEHPVNYPVDDISVLATVDTDFERIPRLDDLTLRAPGFDVGDDPTAAGLPPHTTRDFLVATGGSVERGDSYRFRLEGLPFGRPLGAWISLVAGVVGALLIVVFGRREYLRMREDNNSNALEGLRNRRQQLLDELAEIEQDIQQAATEDEKLDYEQEKMLVRQRLALIMSKIDELTEGDAPADDQAA